MRALLFLLLAALSLSPLQAEDEVDPTDKAMEEAIDKDSSTAGMVRAISDANAQWDKRMNAAYKKLKTSMQSNEWEALVAAQKAWLVFRDAQRKSILAMYGNMDGTMWIPVSAQREMDLTKERARYLESLVSDISER